MGEAARAEGVTLEVLIEIDIGMARCGVEPGEPALALARLIQAEQGLRFVGLQGYDDVHSIGIYVPRKGQTAIINPEQAFNRRNIFPNGIFSIQQDFDRLSLWRGV